jgi:hypothetical protein
MPSASHRGLLVGSSEKQHSRGGDVSVIDHIIEGSQVFSNMRAGLRQNRYSQPQEFFWFVQLGFESSFALLFVELGFIDLREAT